MALCPGLPGWASTKKEKPIWILLKQETVSGDGISWDICKPAPCSRQIPHQLLTTQFFTGRVPFLPPNQQRQSTEGLMTGQWSHKPGGRLPLLSARPAVTLATLKRAATDFAAWRTGTMVVNSLPKIATRQHRGCDLNPDPTTPESSTRTE